MLSTGEHYAYSFGKIDSADIEEVRAIDDRGDWAFRSAGARGGAGAGGVIDVNEYERQRVPEWVEVRWRKMPAPGAEPYTGEPVGPFRVMVRKRIPKDVLEQIRGSENLQLRLIFMIRNGGVGFRWELHDYANPEPGTKLLRSGS